MSKALTVWEEDLLGKAQNTRKSYRGNLNKFLDRYSLSPDELFELRRDSLSSDDPRDVQKVERMVKVQMNEMHEKGYAASSCSILHKGVASFLESQGLPLKLKAKDIPKGYANGQSLAMKEHIRGMWDYAPTENKLKVRALIMILKDSGLRVSDAAALDLDDFLKAKRVDQDGEIFAVFRPKETQKTKAPAHIHLGPETIKAIDAYLEEPRDWQPPRTSGIEEPLLLNRYGRRCSPDTLGNFIMRLAKLVKAENVSAHSLRKYHTTTLQGAGMNDSWIKVLQGKQIQGSMAAYTRPYESGELTEKYIECYTGLKIFGESKKRIDEQSSRIKELEAEVASLNNAQGKRISELEEQLRQKDLDLSTFKEDMIKMVEEKIAYAQKELKRS